MDKKRCWNCANMVVINDYGYGICPKCSKVSFGYRKNYIVVYSDKPHYKSAEYRRQYRAKGGN